jgi:CRP/FNR family transcriptional regulator
VAKLLLDLARGGVGGKVTPHFQMTLTHDDLAEFTSTTRETVTRTLGQFKKEKLIHIQGAAVEILAPEKLAALVA